MFRGQILLVYIFPNKSFKNRLEFYLFGAQEHLDHLIHVDL